MLYRIEEYERLSKEGKQWLEWIKKKRQWVSKVCRYGPKELVINRLVGRI